jgi:hypothetical protein
MSHAGRLFSFARGIGPSSHAAGTFSKSMVGIETEIRKYAAEAFGTAVLVFVGCEAVTAGTYGTSLPIGAVSIGLAFGLAVTALIYSIGPISGLSH